jgi:hypothetical protein
MTAGSLAPSFGGMTLVDEGQSIAMTRVQLSPWVTHERLDDEVIAINLETGAYYALDGVAADCWTLVAAGQAPDEIVATLDARYDASTDTVRDDVTAFLAALVEQGLGAETDEPAGVSANGNGSANGEGEDDVDRAAVIADGVTRAYSAPALTRYDDLDDLLLLDPIHEVDDAGWPIARAE